VQIPCIGIEQRLLVLYGLHNARMAMTTMGYIVARIEIRYAPFIDQTCSSSLSFVTHTPMRKNNHNRMN
jgi:hypothetical protein